MCNGNVNVEVKFIQKQFLCGVPISKIDWSNIFDHFEWEVQEILVTRTVESDLVRKYPIKFSYQKAFLKHIINKLDEQGTEVHDSVYDSLGRVVTLAEPTKYFKHYSFDDRNIITLAENPNIISEGTTGLCSWQASIALAEWCLANTDRFKNKVVLELGSGVGLTGLTVALKCAPARICLTDCHPSVLQVLCDNVKLNLDFIENNDLQNNQPPLSVTTGSCKVEVLKLPWEDVPEKTHKYPNPDLLLAADVIYDASLFPPLINAISSFLRPNGAKELILACTERNRNTLNEFLELLKSSGFNCLELKLEPQVHFVWSTECPIRLFSIRNREAA